MMATNDSSSDIGVGDVFHGGSDLGGDMVVATASVPRIAEDKTIALKLFGHILCAFRAWQSFLCLLLCPCLL